MKPILIILTTILFYFNITAANKKLIKIPFFIYHSYESKLNHFNPTHLLGDKKNIIIKNVIRDDAITGKTCLRIKYKTKSLNKWAAAYWKLSKKEQAKFEYGLNLNKAAYLSFYAKGEKGNEIAEFGFGNIIEKSSGSRTTGKIKLTNQWKLYKIKVNKANLENIKIGFNIIINKTDNPTGAIIFIDCIKYH